MPIAQFATTRLGTPQYTHTVPVADAKASAMSRSSLDMRPNNYSAPKERRCTEYAPATGCCQSGKSYALPMTWLIESPHPMQQTHVVSGQWRGCMDYRDDGEGVTGQVAPPKLLDQVRQRLRVKHYSLRTEQAYVGWIRRFILANGKRHPREMGEREVEAFLTLLATKGNVAAGTQNQALSALLFLYREVLKMDLPWMESVVRAKR